MKKYTKKKPELLAPAGNFEKMKVAFLYGADAVYIGSKNYGLRSAAGNFTLNQIRQGLNLAHEYGKKVYLVVNTLIHNHEINGVKSFLQKIRELDLDGLIISDAGVLEMAKEFTDFEIHLSTQASAVNYESAKFWGECGVKRIILGRETSINEACNIRDKSGLDVEIFIHGSMCMSYSGKCTISNYLSLRDANRGGCTNSCRWAYRIKDLDEAIYLLNSKDLWAIDEIPSIVESGKICSLKIEGRMKNNLYLANTISTYRKAIDFCYNSITNDKDYLYKYKMLLPKMKTELMSNTNRSYTTGFLISRAGKESILYNNDDKYILYEYLGSVIETISNRELAVDIKNPTTIGEEIEIMIPQTEVYIRKIITIKDLSGETLYQIPNNHIAYITIDKPIYNNIDELTIIRKRIEIRKHV
jgi:U32 family peptidase